MFIAFISHFPKQPQLELEPNTSLSCIMAHGHALSDNLCGAILNMARTLDVHSIVEYTGCAILWSGSSQTIVGKKVLSFANILPRSKEES